MQSPSLIISLKPNRHVIVSTDSWIIPFDASDVVFLEFPRNHLRKNQLVTIFGTNPEIIGHAKSTYGTAVPIALASLLAIAMATSDKTGALPPSNA